MTLPSSSHEAPGDFSQVPGAPSTIYLTTYLDGIYKSTDGGASWTKVADTTGLYRGAVSAFDADVVYAAYTNLDTDLLGGVFKSTDGGSTWHVVAGSGGNDSPCTYPPGIDFVPVCHYHFTLAVDPTDPTTFFLGGIRMFKYTNSGATRAPIGYG